MITALNIANNFLERAFQEKIPISPMKLQKLIYILFKEYLKKTGKLLFTERFEAWQYGPVLPSVYSEFKGFKGNPVKNFALNADKSITKVKIGTGSELYNVFYEVWGKYKYKTGFELSDLTHKKEGAWDKAVKNKSYILNDKDIEREPYYE
jgi:hypothetical protein|nr:MAG TPA: hypothetical protein [Caudoviricetes sp.]